MGVKIQCTLESTGGWGAADLATDGSQASEGGVSWGGHWESYRELKNLTSNYLGQLYSGSPCHKLPLSTTSWNSFRLFLFVFSLLLSLPFHLCYPSSTEIISGRDVAWPFTVMTTEALKKLSFTRNYLFKEVILAIHKYECSLVHLKWSKVPVCCLFSGPTEENTRECSHWVALKTQVLLLVG